MKKILFIFYMFCLTNLIAQVKNEQLTKNVPAGTYSRVTVNDNGLVTGNGVAYFELEYNTPGTFSLSIPSNIQKIKVILVGPGGGGAAGRKDNVSDVAPGGGGGGGATTIYELSGTDIPFALNLTIGVGGAGGLASVTSGVDGGAGSNGTDTKLTTTTGDVILIAQGGIGGQSGSLINLGGFGATTGIFQGGDGQKQFYALSPIEKFTSGGGCGGAITSNTAYSGSTGSVSFMSLSGGAGGGLSSNGSNGSVFSLFPVGGAGGGGGASLSGTAGNGGNGVRGSGGGGGGSTKTGTAGNGGKGGDGYAKIIFYYK